MERARTARQLVWRGFGHAVAPMGRRRQGIRAQGWAFLPGSRTRTHCAGPAPVFRTLGLTFQVPPMEPNAGLCFVPGGGTADDHSPAACWGECHVAWIDTRHHPDYFPAGWLQRPVRR